MGLFSFLMGGSSKEEIQSALDRGAVIIDVRTKPEFQSGNVKGSKNIPLNSFESQIDRIKKMNKPVLLVCQSGSRSGVANNILKKHGVESYNAGSWHSLN